MGGKALLCMIELSAAALGWVLALAIGLPLFVLWWWARRNAGPSGGYVDYPGQGAVPPAPAVISDHAEPMAEPATVEADAH